MLLGTNLASFVISKLDVQMGGYMHDIKETFSYMPTNIAHLGMAMYIDGQ